MEKETYEMDGTVITKKGMQLLVKVLATKEVLNITRVAVGVGSIPGGYDPASMIDLVKYKMDGKISSLKKDGDIAKITMQISSIGIETGFTMTEMGVFAEDPDIGEILYAYLDMREDPQYIYAEGGEAQKFMEVTLEVAVEAAAKVSTYINPSSMITREEFEKVTYPEFDDSGTVEEMTGFPAFLEKVKSKMNIFEFYRNFKAGMQFVLHAGQIVNNCVTDRADLPGSAAQLKVLMDLYTKLNSDTNIKLFFNPGQFGSDIKTINHLCEALPSKSIYMGGTYQEGDDPVQASDVPGNGVLIIFKFTQARCVLYFQYATQAAAHAGDFCYNNRSTERGINKWKKLSGIIME